jgi:hypothetical protein
LGKSSEKNGNGEKKMKVQSSRGSKFKVSGAKARLNGKLFLQLQTRKNNLIFVAYFQDEIYGTEK